MNEVDHPAPLAASTAQRLLDAAEALFGELGYEGTSLRVVTDRARANIAAVNYHYGSKERLLHAVVARVMAPVNAERDRRLTALYGATPKPTVEQIVRAFVEPADLTERYPDRPGMARFIATVLLDPSPNIRQVFANEVDPVEGRYLDALRDALPELDAGTVLVAYTNMLGLLALHQAGIFGGLRLRGAGSGAAVDEVPNEFDPEYLISFLVGGLLARRRSSAASE